MSDFNFFAAVFALINGVLLFVLPRRWAPLPLLLGACYMTLAQGVLVGPFHFTFIRIIVGIGFVRVIVRREWVGRMNGMDWLLLVWASWALLSSAFHKDPGAELITHLGLVYNACGIYFLLRAFCRSAEDVELLCGITAIVLAPLAVEMILEQLTVHNMFSVLGGVGDSPDIRNGRIRSQGPFLHSILAGTVGAVSLPLMVGLWQRRRRIAVMGILACVTLVFVSASSAPASSALLAVGALCMWRYRHKMRLFRWLAALGYIGLALVMKSPPYYLMGRLDLVGGSTGWHRAALIESSIDHLHEWWIAGTDFTRHWMPTGVSWSPDHTDITNHYLFLGVRGGLPLMIIHILIFIKAFSYIGKMVKDVDGSLEDWSFLLWALGASLFAHFATSFGVAYFDQSFVFLYLTLALIGSAWSCSRREYNYINRSYDRNFPTKSVGEVAVQVVRDRRREHDIQLPPGSNQREDEVRPDFCIKFLDGMSSRTLAAISRRLIGRKISHAEIRQADKELVESVEGWRNRDLSREQIRYLFVDGVNFDMRNGNSSEKTHLLVAVGVTKSGLRLVLGLRVGDKESVSGWREFFEDLKKRGLDSAGVTMGIMDDLPGLEGAFCEEFPGVNVQYCQFHVSGAVLAEVPHKFKRDVAEGMRSIFHASSREKARELFAAFRTKWEAHIPLAVERLEKSIDACLTFFNFPEGEWIFLRNTNVIETLHKEFKRRIKPMKIVAWERSCYTLLAFIAFKMEMHWRSNPIGRVKKRLSLLKSLERPGI